MVKRKGISKKTRFEVFKRDSFKCQYCGRSAPEVVLHVDHIKPIKENGECNIMNYITACIDCNQGKGARKLSDSSEIEKQKKELDLLNERREQLEMMLTWRNALRSLGDSEIEAINTMCMEQLGIEFTDSGKEEIRKLIKRYSFKEVLDAVDNAGYFDNDKGSLVKYLSMICYRRRNDIEKPFNNDLYYIRGILRNTLSDYKYHENRVITVLEGYIEQGVPVEVLKELSKTSDRWLSFVAKVGNRKEFKR